MPLLPRCLLAVWLALAPLVAGARDTGWAADPVHVWYDGGDCDTAAIEIEVYDREEELWRPHPQHPRVPVPSCQVEDAGHLLNELRWRCHAPGAAAFPGPWRLFEVFDAEAMSRCAVAQQEPGAATAISVLAPAEGVPVRAPEPVVTLVGSVAVGGVDGVAYDVALLVDRSVPPPALAAQVNAARAFARSLAPRLGDVRIAVISFPNLPPASGEATGARRELPFSDDPEAIDAALARLADAPVSSLPTLADALAAALALLEEARPAARPVFVVNVDGTLLDSPQEPAPGHPVVRAAERAGERGVVAHWVAIGGIAADDPPLVERLLEAGRATFRRIPTHRFDHAFLADIALPVPEAVWIERAGAEHEPVVAAIDPHGRFLAEVPVEPGPNPLVIHARTSDGDEARRRFELVFDDAMLLEKILERERERIRAAQRKRLELEAAEEEEDQPVTR